MQKTLTAATEYGFDDWHQFTCQNLSLSECSKASGSPFRAKVSSRRFGSLVLSEVSSSAQDRFCITRGQREIRKDPRDHFMCYLVLEGRVDLAQSGRQASAAAGDLFLYDQAVPFAFDFYRHHSLLMTIPRALLESRIPMAAGLTARRIGGGSRIGALAASVLRQIKDLEASPIPEVESRLAASAVDIVTAALEAELTDCTEAQAVRHRLMPKVESYVLSHLHERELDIETIARALNVAPRTLNRIFASEGVTPIRWLWQRRLAASYRALSEGSASSVTEAAFSSGFNDLSHFSRVFKREFGLLPHEVQRTARNQSRADNSLR